MLEPVDPGRGDRPLTVHPAKLQSLLQEAVSYHRGGRLADAEKLYARARAAAPASFDALHLSGLLAHQQGRFTEAAGWLGKAIKVNPKSALAEMRLGLANSALGNFEVAERHLRSAVESEPALTEAWCHLGVALRALSRPADAEAAYRQALRLKPDYAEAHDRLGALVSETQGFAASIPHFRRAVDLQPASLNSWANLGAALAQSGEPGDALVCFARVLAEQPNHALALTGRALVQQESGNVADAVESYAAVLAMNPRHHEARSGRLLAMHYLDDVSRETLFAAHAEFGEAASQRTTRHCENSRDPARRLRVAFLSPDLRAHSVAYFLEPLLAHLDRVGFEIFLYHDHPKVDAMSERLRAHAAMWRHFAGASHDAVESAIRADAPDVLFDLAGHTGLNRLPLFARRLAPIQISYLGYPNTTGLREMDFRFVDAITDAVGEADQFHSEKLVRFAPTAWSYVAPESAPKVAPPPCLDGRPVTFGCFNNFSKINHTTLRAWSKVMAMVPGSRLLLKGHGLAEPAIGAKLRARFEALGIAADRVELLGRTPGIAAHLALYARMDIALDTFPYHGTTTTCEALWMGRPVVTLRGDRHASRVGASLLTAVGRTEWIAKDWDDYGRIATELARDPLCLAQQSTSLRAEVRGSALMDHAGQAQRFGGAIRDCWTAWCANGQIPRT
ncbi:MAG: hypothetical protein JWM32_1519 [Verrucomicrobia bacterium]|nr:hypothetical protein [Verrucomicrobiota bacterium]